MYKVKDIKLSENGRNQLEWAEEHMAVLMGIRRRFEKELPLKGIKISAVLHVTKETGALALTLKAGGAEVKLAGSNPLSTQDDVAAFLASEGIEVFAWRGETLQDYYDSMVQILKDGADIVMDDGADLHTLVHEKFEDLHVIGGTEETTTGVNRLKVMEEEGLLKYPVIAVNNAFTKYLFDNRIGTGQSTIDGILRATNLLLAGKTIVVAGYGWVGRGIASRMRGMGAKVIVTEVDPVRALEAVMDGFEVMPMAKASPLGDVFVTATGNKGVIREEHMKNMKDGAILANSGHFDVEVDVSALRKMSSKVVKIRPGLEKYIMTDGKKIYLLAEGRLVNLGTAEGHPSEVMDMSFANQALAVEYLVRNKGKVERKVLNVPVDIDRFVASMKLKTMNVEIDEMTLEQREYVKQWKYGT
jgi:adenosylhomocysteinase